MRFNLIDAAKEEFLCSVWARSRASVRAATFSGKIDRPVVASIATWCSWRMSGRRFDCRMAPTGVLACGMNCSRRDPHRAPADGPTDVGERSQGPVEAAFQANDRQPARLPDCAQSPRPEFCGRAARREVGCRHLLHLDARRLVVSGCHHRPVRPACRRMGR